MVCLPCDASFHPDQIRAAFVRCFASLFYTYKKFLIPANGEKKKSGMYYTFNMEAFMKSLPSEHAEYIAVLQQTQGESEYHVTSCNNTNLYQASMSSSVIEREQAPSPRTRG
jgi:cytidine deaminase